MIKKTIIITIIFLILFSFSSMAFVDHRQDAQFADSGWVSNTPTSWDHGMVFRTNFNESGKQYFFLSAQMPDQVSADTIQLWDDNQVLEDSCSVVNLTCNMTETANGVLLVNDTIYRLQAFVTSSMHARRFGTSSYPFVNGLITFISMCGDNNDAGDGCVDASANLTTNIYNFRFVTIREVGVASVQLDVKIFNETSSDIIGPSEFQLFNINANYSLQGIPSTTASCNWTGNNISSIFTENGANFTFNGANQKEMIFNEEGPGGTVINDATEIQLCRNGASLRDVQMRYNGSILNNISGSLIPLCPAFHEEFFITTDLIADASVNVTISCDSCTGGQTITLISRETLGGTATIFQGRLYSQHPIIDMPFNATTSLWEDRSLHGYPIPGNYSINVSCNETLESKTVITAGVQPLAQLVTIQDFFGAKNFTNGTLIESGNVSVIGECSQDIIVTRQVNLTYENGTLIQSNSGDIASWDSSLIAESTTYNVTLLCVDDEGDFDIESKFFIVNDTITPESDWVFPSIFNISLVFENATMTVDVTATDLNIHSFNLTCRDNLSVVKHSFFSDSIISPFQYTNVTDPFTNLGLGACTLIVKDRHTKNDLKDIDLNPKHYPGSKMIEFKYKGWIMNITLQETYDNFLIIKERDRYTFEPVFNGNNPDELNFEIECNSELEYWDDKKIDKDKDKYGHYFGCGDFWADFNIDGVEYKKYKVTDLAGERYRVNIKIDDKKLKLKTKSVGIKNTLTDVVTYNVIVPPDQTGLTTLTEPIALFYIALLIIWVALLFATLLFRFSVIGIFTGLYGVALGVSLMLTNQIRLIFIIGIIFIIFNGLFTLFSIGGMFDN